jgi:gliding-associated putative ABC transporter substrate-binding component GldG
MVKWKSRKFGDLLWIVNMLLAAILLNVVANMFSFRIDLTEENRYTIKDQTIALLRNLDEEVYVEVYLGGELNAGFRRFRKSIEETLEEFSIRSGNRVRYTFTDPATAMGQKAQNEFMADLAARGIQPTNVVDKKDGQRVEKIVFPGALISYGGFETGVMLLKGNKTASSEEVINQSIEGVEFELANAIFKLTNTERKQVGLIEGHGELDSLEVAAFNSELLEFYDVFRVDLSRKNDLARYDVLIIAKPRSEYSPLEKYKLDQFIMQGGKVMFLIDKLEASMDSASRDDYFAFPYRHNLDDQLFRYGARINLDLVQDQSAALYPIVTGQVGGNPKMQLIDWPFFPLISNYPDHPVTRNLDAIMTRFVSSIDTVKADGVKKTPLLVTSRYARTVGAPVNISVNQLRNMSPAQFDKSNIPVAYLLEGSFTSLYKNRFPPEGADSASFRDESAFTRMVVVADGDIARNAINPRTGQPQELGFDPFSNYTFANRDFLMNALAFLTNEAGLIQARNKEIKIRPLDRQRIQDEKTFWQIINIALPLFILIAFGVARSYIRKRRYANF